MFNLDEQIMRVYKNPYERRIKPMATCHICGESIYEIDDSYVLLGKTICTSCIQSCKRIGG